MTQLRRVLGFRDLLLFYLVTGFSLRWIATAAAAGPSALVIWAIAALGLFVPLAGWIPALMLIALGAVSWSRFGSATPMDAQAFVPSTSLKDVIFWSTIAFAFGGVESASTMGDEIRDARRTVPRAILAAGVV